MLCLCSLFEASQSLFWASFGNVGIENFQLEGIKSYTRFWGLLMFGSYSVINVIVLLNLLIAMMSTSYAMIEVRISWRHQTPLPNLHLRKPSSCPRLQNEVKVVSAMHTSQIHF